MDKTDRYENSSESSVCIGEIVIRDDITTDELNASIGEIESTAFDNISNNNYGEIVIDGNIATDTLEYNSHKEAEAAAEMYSLQNFRIEEHGSKYKLVMCSEAMDTNKKHLKVGDKVHYGLFSTWEIVDIGRDEQYPDILGIHLKSGEHTKFVCESTNNKGEYIFYQLKAGKIDGEYIVLCILASILKPLDKVDADGQQVFQILTAVVLFILVMVGLFVLTEAFGPAA